MSVRNYVTHIMSTDGVVRGSEETERKANAETKKSDPSNANEVIDKHTKAGKPNPNTKLDAEEKRNLAEGKNPGQEQAQKEKEDNLKKAEETTVRPQDIANPASSQEKNQQQHKQNSNKK
jgi:hypothetical protein